MFHITYYVNFAVENKQKDCRIAKTGRGVLHPSFFQDNANLTNKTSNENKDFPTSKNKVFFFGFR